MKIKKSTRIVLFVFMLLFCVIIIIPFLIMFSTSLKTSAEISSAAFRLWPERWQFSNYVEAMRSSDWGRFFWNSFYTTVLSVVISLVINSLAGYAFARMVFKGKDFLFLLALVGMMIPQQVTMLPNFVAMKYFPLIGGNNMLGQGGTGLVNTYAGMVAPYIAGAFGVFLFRQFFMNFPKSLDDAAKIDGLSRMGAFVRIYLPLSKSIFATLIVFKTTSTWNEYTWPLIITTRKNMWTVQLALSVFKEEFITQWNYLMAATTLIMLPLLVMYVFMQKYSWKESSQPELKDNREGKGKFMKTVLILMDTLNRRYLRIYNEMAKGITPNIDAFSADCAVYDNHFIGSAPCMPARRDIFTGRMQFLERGWGGIEPFDITLPQVLRQNGVFTHITTDHTHYFEIGGENYCYLFNTWEYHRGQEFDTWISRVKQPPVDPESYGKKSSQYLLNKTRFVTEEEYPSPRTFRSACEWVEQNRGADDFFLMVESFDPHEPFDCPEKYHRMYEDDYTGREFCWPSYAEVTEPADAVEHLEKCYLGTLSMADHWFGRLLQTLKDNGMYEDTLIIFTTDHGHMLGEHGFTGKNIMHAYNEMAHIPLMIHFPGGKEAGKRIKELTQNIDLMPTILQHHSCAVPDRVKGMSLLDVVRKKSSLREQVIYGWFGRAVNVYDGRYTYFRAPASRENGPLYQYCGIPSTCWRYFDERYAEAIEMGRFLPYTRYPVYRIPVLFPEDYSGNIEYVMESCLYDLETDYEQLHNLKDAEKETEMCKKLVAGMREAEAPAEQYRRLGVEISNAMHLSGWLGREVTLPLDEELFLQELNKKRVSSKKKTGVQELTFDVDGSYGNRP